MDNVTTDKPSLAVIKLAHSGHLKWWAGSGVLTAAEKDAIIHTQHFDVIGILLDMLASNVPAA